jgi:hypothetical protein
MSSSHGAPWNLNDGDALSSERVASWFFRLNGCLTIDNFILHPDFINPLGGQRTDADILGVRFPHRSEDQTRPMPDHPKLRCDRLLLFIAEVKLDECRLNGPWTNRRRGNMQRVLSAVGVYSLPMVNIVAEALYSSYRFRDSHSEVRLYAVGDRAETMAAERPGVATLTWSEMFAFIHERFSVYRHVKAQHEQWDETGRELFRLTGDVPDRDRFVEVARARLEDGHGHRLVS